MTTLLCFLIVILHNVYTWKPLFPHNFFFSFKSFFLRHWITTHVFLQDSSMTIFLLNLTEIASHLELSHLVVCPVFSSLSEKKKKQSAVEMCTADRYSTSLVLCITEERILALFPQGLIFLDHCFLFFWLLLGGSFPQAAWKKESRKAVGKSNGIITSDTKIKIFPSSGCLHF